jgi:hypothetical protein
MSRERIDVKQAAHILGISTDAVHKRVKRGTLGSDKDPDGRVFVYLEGKDIDDGHTHLDDVYTPPNSDVRDELVEELRYRIRYLEEESHRKDSIILTMAQRIPELEALTEGPRESPETASEEERRPWWKRIFG